MKVDVVYFVESVPKELDVACIVRTLARQRFGLNIELASYKAHVPDWLLRTHPALLVVPTCYAADAWGIRRHVGRWPTTPFLNLTWEELFCRANLTWKHPRDTFAQKHVQHHVWGDFYKDFLLSHGVPADHVLVNGNLGYRLYTEPYRRYYPTRADLARKHGLDPGKRWIFLPENYGWAFYGPENLAARVREGMDPATPPLLQEYCRSTLRTVLDWCQDLVRQADLELIIRPRPTTSLTQFEHVCRELHGVPLEGVRIIKDGTVNEWILASDVVVSSFSTSLIEAAIADKPAYMLEPLPLPDPLWAIWNDDADSLTTREAFLSACLLAPAHRPEQRLRRWADANLLANGDPIDNLVNYIADVCDRRVKLPLSPVRAPLVPRPRHAAVKALVSVALNGVHRMVTGTGQRDARSMAFDKADVDTRTKAWNRVLEGSLVSHGPRPSIESVDALGNVKERKW